jgi:hypothetical protein
MATDESDSSGGEGPRKGSVKRKLLRLAIIAVVVYAAFVILLAVFQRRLIYYPSRDYEGVPSDVSRAYEDVTFHASDGVKLTGWFVPHGSLDEAAGATALFFHGNAGNISHRLHTIDILHRIGFSVFIIDYRGFGKSAGKPSERGLYLDAEAAWAYLTESRGVPAERIVLIGRSLGGGVAIELASRKNPGALVVESTFTSLVDVAREHFRFFPVGLILREKYESIRKIGSVKCPVLILHGTDDELIPIAQGRALFEAANEPKRFIETPGGHNEAGFTYNLDYVEQMRAYLKEVMK